MEAFIPSVMPPGFPFVKPYSSEYLLAGFDTRCPKATALLEPAFDEVTAVLALPGKYHRLLRTTNSVERLNEEIRRRDRVIRIYPNRASCERLLEPVTHFFKQPSCQCMSK